MAYMIAKRDRKTRTYVLIKREGIPSPAPLIAEVQAHLADELLTHCLRVQEIAKGLEQTFPDNTRLHDAGQLAALALSQLVEAHSEAFGAQHVDDHEQFIELCKANEVRHWMVHMGALYAEDGEEESPLEPSEQRDAE